MASPQAFVWRGPMLCSPMRTTSPKRAASSFRLSAPIWAYCRNRHPLASIGQAVNNARRELETAQVRQRRAMAPTPMSHWRRPAWPKLSKFEHRTRQFGRLQGHVPPGCFSQSLKPARSWLSLLPQRSEVALDTGMAGNPAIEAAEINVKIARDTRYHNPRPVWPFHECQCQCAPKTAQMHRGIGTIMKGLHLVSRFPSLYLMGANAVLPSALQSKPSLQQRRI